MKTLIIFSILVAGLLVLVVFVLPRTPAAPPGGNAGRSTGMTRPPGPRPLTVFARRRTVPLRFAPGRWRISSNGRRRRLRVGAVTRISVSRPPQPGHASGLSPERAISLQAKLDGSHRKILPLVRGDLAAQNDAEQ